MASIVRSARVEEALVAVGGALFQGTDGLPHLAHGKQGLGISSPNYRP